MSLAVFVEPIFPAAIFGIADHFIVGEHSMKFMGLSYIGYLVESILYSRGNTSLLSSGLGFVTFEALQYLQHDHLFEKRAITRAGEYIAADFLKIPVQNMFNKYTKSPK